MATALIWWAYVVPDVTTLQTLSWGVGAVALRGERGRDLCLLRRDRAVLVREEKAGHPVQVQRQVPADQPSDVFWFKSQNIDNFLRSLLRVDPALDAG
jgi:hypothetical protein